MSTDITKNLRKMRRSKNASVTDLAELLGISAPAYRRYERGEVEPKISQAVMICNFLNCTLDEIWNPSGTPAEVDLTYTIKPGQTVRLAMHSPVENKKDEYETSLNDENEYNASHDNKASNGN
tara:strand:- start:2162 stop:2530 length:369 start_codon:yes stop_codon:yes gene_type:complete